MNIDKDTTTRETLEELTTVKFNKPLNTEEFERLFLYIAHHDKAPADLRTNHKMSKLTNISSNEVGEIEIKITNVSYLGTINYGGHSASFSADSSSNEKNEIEKLKFDTISGYKLEEHSSGTKEVWRFVKDFAKTYDTWLDKDGCIKRHIPEDD